MAIPSRRDNMIKNFMKLQRNKNKEIKTKEKKPKNPDDVKNLLEMWEKMKEDNKK